MRRAVATGLVLAAVLVAGTSGAGGPAAAAVVRARPAKVKCHGVRQRAMDVLAGDSNERLLLPGNRVALRLQLASLGKRKRKDLLHALVNAAVVMCTQKAHGVPWTSRAAKVYLVPSEAMKPAVGPGDHVLLNLKAYEARAPKRGEIVLHRPPPGTAPPNATGLVKRIVGMPGETIEGRDGQILIDGRPLAEPYLRPRVKSRTFGPEQVPPGTYFMLGDNRQYSKDSTFYGPIARTDVLGSITVV